MGRTLASWTLTLSLVAAAQCASAAEPTALSVTDLPKLAKQSIGRRIVTQGCLVINRHGTFIQPCGNDDWKLITLISDPKYLAIKAFNRRGVRLWQQAEGIFVGTIVELEVTWPKPGKQIFLQLESVQISNIHKDQK